MSEKKKYIRRHPPCHPCDVEGTESWLTDMARKGYVLAKVPARFGFLCFKIQEPTQLCFRLEASPEGEGKRKDAGEPDTFARELNEKYGWEFVTKSGAFYVYRSEGPCRRELNTDPEVQAYSLKILVKKELVNLILIVIWLAAMAAEFIRGGLPAVIDAPSAVWIIFIAVFISSLIGVISQIIQIKRLRTALRRNGTLNHEKKVRKRAFIYAAGRFMPVLLVIFSLMTAAYTFLPMMKSSEKAVSDIPFAGAQELLYAESAERGISEIQVTYTDFGQWRNPLSPKNIYIHEEAEALDSRGNKISCFFTANCHELLNEALAQKTAEDYHKRDLGAGNTEITSLPSVAADYSAACITPSDYVAVVIRKGRKVIRAEFYLFPDADCEYADRTAAVLAESI